MSESYEVPIYSQNELIHAEVRFRYAPGVERVIAYFRHQVNPYVHQALFGHVVSQSGNDYVARLAGRATVIEDAYGEHRCESLYVELEDGRTISFESVPDVRFEIVPSAIAEAVEQPTSNEPVLVAWTWE
ncbi:MAG TPA: hypothetical protein VK869_14835 [Rubrobacteraceae bacterium]|nr:hypothetical protein [Rubrobacteraceae bacterium]